MFVCDNDYKKIKELKYIYLNLVRVFYVINILIYYIGFYKYVLYYYVFI